MAQPTLIPNSEGARFESLPLDAPRNHSILALDLGTSTGWAIRSHDGLITSGTVSLRPSRFDGGGMPYQGVPVGTIKRHATAKGNAGKDAVVGAVTARGFNPKDNNEADAIALLLWAIETRGGVR